MKRNKIKTLAATALATVVGFSTVSVNAASAVVDVLPETVTRADIAKEYKFLQSGITIKEGITNNVIEFMSEDGKYLLYCSDRNNDRYESRVTLTKGQKMDYRIAYILKKGYNQQNLIEDITDKVALGNVEGETAQAGKGNDMANLWITQVALWNFQNTITSSDLDNSQLSYTIDNKDSFNMFKGSANLASATLWQYVDTLVSSANSKSDPANATVSITGDTNWTKSDNISKSGLITVASSNNEAAISTYNLSLEGAPENTRVYTENGTDITDNLENVAAGTKIYITLDNSKIDKAKEYNFKLNATANIVYDAAYQYVDNANQCNGQACQPSVLVGPETKQVASVLNFKIIPDTASSLSKSIYYIGFIILLCGLGLIYANVRPRREEAE